MKGWALLLLLLPLAAQEPTVRELAEEVMRNKRAQDRDLTEYTSDYTDVRQYFDRFGRPGRRLQTTGESYQSSTRSISVVLTQNGAPVSAKTVEKKRLDAAKQLQADFDRRLARGTLHAGEGPEYGAEFAGFRMEIYLILRNCPLQNLRRETLDGRPTWVFDYFPAPAPVGRMPHLTEIQGTFWIDAQDRLPRRWNVTIARGPSAGHLLWEAESEKVLNRAWIGTRLLLDLNLDWPGRKGARVRWEVSSRNFRRFGVEVEEKIASPPATNNSNR